MLLETFDWSGVGPLLRADFGTKRPVERANETVPCAGGPRLGDGNLLRYTFTAEIDQTSTLLAP